MKTLTALGLIFLSMLATIDIPAFAGSQCTCKPCHCEQCKCVK